jgi:hypothetical protein
MSQSWDRKDAVERNGHLQHDPVHIQTQSWAKQQTTSQKNLKSKLSPKHGHLDLLATFLYEHRGEVQRRT